MNITFSSVPLICRFSNEIIYIIFQDQIILIYSLSCLFHSSKKSFKHFTFSPLCFRRLMIDVYNSSRLNFAHKFIIILSSSGTLMENWISSNHIYWTVLYITKILSIQLYCLHNTVGWLFELIKSKNPHEKSATITPKHRSDKCEVKLPAPQPKSITLFLVETVLIEKNRFS